MIPAMDAEYVGRFVLPIISEYWMNGRFGSITVSFVWPASISAQKKRFSWKRNTERNEGIIIHLFP